MKVWTIRGALATVAVGAAVCIAACSSSPSGSGGSGGSSTSVGAAGGTVTATGGSGVTIPAGALASNATITVTATPNATPPPDGTVVSTPYTFGPEGQQFAAPVTVTLAFDATKIPAGKTASDIVIFTAPAGTTAYTALATTLADSTHVAAQVSHFSVFVGVVAATEVAQDAGLGSEDAGGPSDAAGPSEDAMVIATNEDSGCLSNGNAGASSCPTGSAVAARCSGISTECDATVSSFSCDCTGACTCLVADGGQATFQAPTLCESLQMGGSLSLPPECSH